MDIKIIFFDIDGTLVSFKTHKMSLAVQQRLDLLKRNGIKLIIATGRPLYDINNLDGFEFDGYITLNGAYCITQKETLLHKSTIPDNDKVRLLEYAKSKNVPFIFMTEDGNFANRIDEQVIAINKMVNLSLPSIKPIDQIMECDIFQIDAFVGEEEEKYLTANILKACEGSRWHPSFTDINVKGNNKATGMKAFLEYYNLKQENTVAFGDGGNDISMLEYARVGVAMENANEDVKSKADYITLSVDEDGVIHALNHLI